MIILRTFSDNIRNQKRLLNDILTDYIKRERKAKKKKEILNKLKDIANDPKKLKKGAIITGLSALGTGTVIAGSISEGKRIKRKIDERRDNEKVKKSISE